VKTRAIVISIDTDSETILVATQEREFIRIPLPSQPVMVGEELEVELDWKESPAPKSSATLSSRAVSFRTTPSGKNLSGISPQQAASYKPTHRWTRYLGLVAAVLLLALIGLYTRSALFAEPSYIALDINPSIELAVSNGMYVVDLIPRNQDGAKLLAGLKAGAKKENMTLKEAVGKIIQEAVRLGYLKKGGNYRDNVVIATVIPSTPLFGTKLKVREISTATVENIIEEKLLSAQIESKLVVQKTTRGNRQQALAKGLSVNQYLVYSRSAAKNNNVPPVAKLKGLSLKDTIKTLPGNTTLLPAGKIIKKTATNINNSCPDGQRPGKKKNERINTKIKEINTGSPNEAKTNQKNTKQNGQPNRRPNTPESDRNGKDNIKPNADTPKYNDGNTGNNQGANTNGQDTGVENKSTGMNEKDTGINKKSTDINDKDTGVDNKDTNTNGQDTGVENKSTGMNEKDTGINKKSTDINDKDTGVDNKGTNTNGQDTGIDNKSNGMNRINTGINEKDTGINNRGTDMNEKDTGAGGKTAGTKAPRM